MAYDNILNAIGKGKLTPAQEVANYSAFSDLQKQGVYLPDLVKRITDMESKLASIEQSKTDADADLFAVMEQAVRDDKEVREAHRRIADEKTRIIAEMCAKDEGYIRAVADYRRAVNSAYIRRTESTRGSLEPRRNDEDGKDD